MDPIVQLTDEQKAEYHAAAAADPVVTLSPEQQAEYQAKATAIDPLRDFTPKQLVELQVSDPDNFDMVNSLLAKPNFQRDPETMAKVADAYAELGKRGVFQDLPSIGQLAKNVWGFVKGRAKLGANVVQAAATPVGDVILSHIVPNTPPDTTEQAANIMKRDVGEAVSAIESDVRGLGETAIKAGKFIGRKIGLTKSLENYTPQEKLDRLWDAIESRQTQQRVLSGEGTATSLAMPFEVEALKDTNFPIRPESVSELAAGGPASLPVFRGLTRGAAAITPAPVRAAAATIGEKAAEIVPKVVGRTAQGVSKAVETVAPAAGATAGAVKGFTLSSPIVGPFGGLLAGYKAGQIGLQAGKTVAKIAGKATNVGREIATGITTGSMAQLGRDVLESVPGVAAEVAKGAAFDAGFLAAAETPQEKQGVGLGIAFGLTGGAARTGIHALGGQLTAPFAWNALDNTSRVKAVSDFAAGLGKQLVYEPDEARMTAILTDELIKAGATPELAKTTAADWARQRGGMFTAIPDKIFVRELPAAPHESFHAMQAVLGEPANLALDKFIQNSYSPQTWDALGRDYAARLGGDPADWINVILDKSGWRRDAEAQAGRPLSPEEATALANRYMSREIAAEHFDVLFKHKLTPTDAIGNKLARTIANFVDILGGNPVATRTSEAGTPLDYGVLRKIPREAKPAIELPSTGTPVPVKPVPPAPVDEWLQQHPQPPEKDAAVRQLSEAAASNKPLTVLYWGAKGEPASDITSVRPERRAEIESQRGEANKDRELQEKLIYPYKIEFTKSSGPQFVGWSPDNFNANRDKLAAWLSGIGADNALPYEIGPDGKFTVKGIADLNSDLQTFVTNQRNGYTGSGKPLIVPESVVRRGFTAPPVREQPIPLAQDRADLLNYLFNAQIPEGVSKPAPLHVAGQDISEATLPGRVTLPIRPRGEYSEAQLAKMKVAGPRGVREVNPVRQLLEQLASDAGVPPPSLIEVSQRLNHARIEAASPAAAPTTDVSGANVLTLAAGFQPRNVEDVARDYARKAGIEYVPPKPSAAVNVPFAKQVADWYDSVSHNPADPTTKSAYTAFMGETLDQFDAIKQAGYTIEPWTKSGEPYSSSADMVADVTKNKHLFFLPTGTQMATDNLLAQPSGEQIGNYSLSINDVFRAVHDFFGHARAGHQFGPKGEFNAWKEHSALYSKTAQPALAAETLAQNSWVNYGRQLRTETGEIPQRGEPGFKPLPERPFAEQKNVAMPESMLSQAAQFQPKWYSQLDKVIREKLPERTTVDQLRGLIANPQHGIKREEIEWSGLPELLSQGGKVTKQQVLETLTQNAVQIREIQKSDEPVSQTGLFWNEEENQWSLHDAESGRRYATIVDLGEGEDHRFSLSFPDQESDYGYRTLSEAKHAALLETEERGGEPITKFAEYTLPGGSNYREVLFQLPEEKKQTKYTIAQNPEETEYAGVPTFDVVGPTGMVRYTGTKSGAEEWIAYAQSQEPSIGFKSSHFDEPNVLAHARVNDRTDESGNPILFVEEIQSDWHQQGRKYGYKSEGGKPLSETPGATATPVPDAPFRTTWHEVVFRRLVQQAAQEGKTAIAWTTGDQQAERYDLSKRISLLRWYPMTEKEGTLIASSLPHGDDILNRLMLKTEVPDYIGKDAAEKLFSAPITKDASDTDVQQLKGLDLKVGGEGMRGFYDKIISDYANKFGKRFGAKVRDISIPQEEIEPGSAPSGFFPGDKPNITVHSLPITPVMADSVTKLGIAQFAGKRKQPKAGSELDWIDKTDFSRYAAKPAAPKVANEYTLLPGDESGISKAWILPSGQVVNLGKTWHHVYLNQNPDLRAKYNIPESPEGESNRIDALRKGFVRLNFADRSGLLTVEGRAKDWRRQKNVVERFVEENLGKIDNMTVYLYDESVNKILDSDSQRLFNYSGPEKLAHLPLITESEPRMRTGGQFAPDITQFEDEKTLPEALAKPGWAIITATQESVGPANHPDNVAANKRLREELATQYNFVSVRGTYKGVDQGENFLVMGISPDDALAIGKSYGQESVLTPDGLLYTNGTRNPINPDQTLIGESARKQDFYSELPNGTAFTLGIDFGTREKTVAATAQFSPRESEPDFPELGLPKPRPRLLSSAEVAGMTRQQLADYYPEAVIPRTRAEEIPSKIVESPRYRKSDDPEKAFAEGLTDFAKSNESDPVYQSGLRWYSDFAPELRRRFGKHAQLFAELLAATSPRNSPETNFRYALEALNGLRSGEYADLVRKYDEGLAKLADGSWRKWLTSSGRKLPAKPTEATFLAHWIDEFDLIPRRANGKLFGMHSVPVLQVFARRWLTQNKGPKTLNFVANLLGQSDEATIDLWADRTMRRLGYESYQPRWRILPGNSKGVSDKDFAFSQLAFARAAKQLGVKPSALQGGLWFAEKKLWADNGWTRLDLGDYRTEIAKLPEKSSPAKPARKIIRPEMIYAR